MVVKPRSLQSRLVLGGLALAACSVSAVHAAFPSKPSASATPSPVKLIAAATTQGTFRPAETPVRGGFRIHQNGTTATLELSSDFKTNDLAPDLKIAFSPSRTPLAMSKPPAYPLAEGTYTVLAPLRATSGAQSYEILRSIDLALQGSVLIWCEQFNATMAWAPLK